MQMQKFSKKFSSWKYGSAPLIVSMLLFLNIGVVACADETTPPSPDVMRDIAEIQRHLGGSIVEGRHLLSPSQPIPPVPINAQPSMHPGRHPRQYPRYSAPYPAAPKSPIELKVDLLRNASAQLDAIASQLEFSDLYSEADNLREMAHDFRREARKLRKK